MFRKADASSDKPTVSYRPAAVHVKPQIFDEVFDIFDPKSRYGMTVSRGKVQFYKSSNYSNGVYHSGGGILQNIPVDVVEKFLSEYKKCVAEKQLVGDRYNYE